MRRRRLLLGAVALVLVCVDIPAPGQQQKEGALPITKDALLGQWEGRLGKALISARFDMEAAEIKVMELKPPVAGMSIRPAYAIDQKAKCVRLAKLVEGHLIQGGGLRLRMLEDLHTLPKGTVVTLHRPMPR